MFRKPPDTAVVREHGAADRGAAGAHRMGCGRKANRAKEGGTERCVTNHVKSDTSRFFFTRRSQNWPLTGPLNSLERGRTKKAVSMDAPGCRIDGGQEAKSEILVNTQW